MACGGEEYDINLQVTDGFQNQVGLETEVQLLSCLTFPHFLYLGDTLLPIDKFHGYFTFTPGFITSPLPIFAPKSIKHNFFTLETGIHLDLTRHKLTKYQSTRISTLAPGLYQLLS